MIDLYLFNTIVNTIWYFFTILFVLYRFTSFFSYIYNFVRFCGKLFNGIYFVYDQICIYIRKRRGYVYLPSDDIEAQNHDILLPDQNSKHKTLLQKCKDYFTTKYDYYYFKIFGKKRNFVSVRQDHANPIHLTETSYSSNNFNNYSRQSERELFDKQLSELCADKSIDFNDYIEQHSNLQYSTENSSLFDVNYKIGKSERFDKSKGDDRLFQSIELNSVDPKDSFLNNDYFKNFNQSHENENCKMQTEETDSVINNNAYGIQDSNLLLDSSFIKRVQSTTDNTTVNTNIFIKPDCYPQFTKKITTMSSSYKRNIATIQEEDEEYDYSKKRQKDKENHKENHKHVFHVDSLWGNSDFYTADSEVLDLQNNDTDTHTVSNQQQYGVDINNSSTYLRNNISYSMIANNKLGSDSDDDYASQILKNPYI
jgi:hypothetical protein